MESNSYKLANIPLVAAPTAPDAGPTSTTKPAPTTTVPKVTPETITETAPSSATSPSWLGRINTALGFRRFTDRGRKANTKSLTGFRPFPVTVLTLITYITLFGILIWIDRQPPKVAPQNELDDWGVSVDEAYSDLQNLTSTMHPYNSRENDVVRQFLVDRLRKILSDNGVEGFTDGESEDSYEGTVELINDGVGSTSGSNVTFFKDSASSTVYFEGMNIIVYIHGEKSASELSPVLVSAHYDSVSTGFGATDDGVGIVSILQAVKSFTRPEAKGGKRLPRGLIALLNNGEEDGLNGAQAFAMHPVGKLPHMFLNLEGAGTGGRATLFRSGDSAVTRFYKNAKRPFGSALSGDAFRLGLIRSNTDYQVYRDTLGMRGLDLAFYTARSRYHSLEDDTRHTSKRSIWHMLGAVLETLHGMGDDTSSEFDQDGSAGKGKPGVWFDFFGRSFAVYDVRTLFSWTVSLLIIPPCIIAGGLYLLGRDNIPKNTRGRFRFPVAFLLASAAAMIAAVVIHKANPLIIYSSSNSVWATLLSTWWIVAWVILKGADVVRPTALARGYAWFQMFILWLLFMIAVAYSSSPKVGLASGYWILALYMGAFAACCITIYELFMLRKRAGVEGSPEEEPDDVPGPSNGRYASNTLQANEATPLAPSSALSYNQDIHSQHSKRKDDRIYRHVEGWTWIPQFLMGIPLQMMFIGPISLLLTTALEQTGSDGGNTLMPYLMITFFAIMILLPITPFLHRIAYHVTLVIFLIFIWTGIYNLAAFPFSKDARLKFYVKQTIDLQSGENLVHLVGHPDFIENAVSNYIPSATTGNLTCGPESESTRYSTQKRCSWTGPSPNIDPTTNGTASWVSYNITKLEDGNALISLVGVNTRACRIFFDNKNVTSIEVQAGERQSNQTLLSRANMPAQRVLTSPTYGSPVPEWGSNQLRLWSREWGRGWEVEVMWDTDDDSDGDLEGRIVCLWSDANADETIPAFTELRQYLPVWAGMNKFDDGLLEGTVPFVIS